MNQHVHFDNPVCVCPGSPPAVSPPVLAVPPGGQMVSVREGGNTELACLVVDGKPRPPVLWSRVEKDLLMPGGRSVTETPDGRLRLRNVSRDMMGAYRCQTAPYNGLNIKRREAQVQLNVQCKSIRLTPARQHCGGGLLSRTITSASHLLLTADTFDMNL